MKSVNVGISTEDGDNTMTANYTIETLEEQLKHVEDGGSFLLVSEGSLVCQLIETMRECARLTAELERLNARVRDALNGIENIEQDIEDYCPYCGAYEYGVDEDGNRLSRGDEY